MACSFLKKVDSGWCYLLLTLILWKWGVDSEGEVI